MKIKGLATITYIVKDLPVAKAWFSNAFGVEPYFDQPFYVGYSVGGYELGLSPGESVASPAPDTITFWRVENLEETLDRFVKNGAPIRDPIQDVGDGILVAAVTSPFGHVIGFIKNPHFKITE